MVPPVAYVALGALLLVAFWLAGASHALRASRTRVDVACASLQDHERYRRDLEERMQALIGDTPPELVHGALGADPEFVELFARMTELDDRIVAARHRRDAVVRDHLSRRAQLPRWLLHRVDA
jgi:hypothetical protein